MDQFEFLQTPVCEIQPSEAKPTSVLEKSITTCLLCKNLVGSSIDTIESNLEGFIVGIIDGAVNGFFEQSNVNILIYNRNTFFNNLGILIGWKLLELDLCELLCWSL